MELKRMFIGTPGSATIGGPERLPTGIVPLGKKWLIREIVVVHHGTSSLDPPAYVTVSAGPVGYPMTFTNWQDNALLWACGPHDPLSPPTVYPFFFTLNATEQLAASQFYRTLPGALVDGGAYLNVIVSGLEVDA